MICFSESNLTKGFQFCFKENRKDRCHKSLSSSWSLQNVKYFAAGKNNKFNRCHCRKRSRQGDVNKSIVLYCFSLHRIVFYYVILYSETYSETAAGLAQSVERLTAEREVAGSIPGAGPILRVLK